MTIDSKNNFYTGILFLVIGVTFSFLSLKYDLGTASEIGPAFFPFIASITLILISIITIVGSIKIK